MAPSGLALVRSLGLDLGFEAVCRMVSAGVGLGMVPLSAVAEGTAPLAVVELEEPWAQRDLKVCVRKRESLSRFAVELVAFLTEDKEPA